jgi:two-component system OmpR family response regulator
MREGFMIKIDVKRYEVYSNGKELHLPKKEFDMLYQLVKADGHVLSREKLLSSVWGIDEKVDTRTVDQHICRLRVRLGKDASCLRTIHGRGYRYKARQP